MSPGKTAALRRRAILALLACTALWGASFPLNKVVQIVHEAIEPGASGWFYAVSAIWPRFGFAMLILVFVIGRAGIPRCRREVVQGVGLALFMSVGLVLQVDGIRYTEASTSAFLSQFFVVLVPIVVYGRLRRLPSTGFVVATIVVVAGLAILSGFDWRTLHMGRGELETLASTAFFAGQVLWLERPVFRENRPLAVTQVMFLTTFGLFAVSAFVLAPTAAAVVRPILSPSWIGFTVCLAVFCTVGTFTLMNTWQPRMASTEAGIIYSAEPVFASILAMFLPGWFSLMAEGVDYPDETITARLLIGGGLITAANLLVQLRPPVK